MSHGVCRFKIYVVEITETSILTKKKTFKTQSPNTIYSYNTCCIVRTMIGRRTYKNY